MAEFWRSILSKPEKTTGAALGNFFRRNWLQVRESLWISGRI